jgi:hypothetical protein
VNWINLAFVALVSVFVMAIIAGRSTRTIPHKVAFASGILGLLGFPALIVASFLSLCIAGACSDGMGLADYLGVAWLVLAATSFIALVSVWVRRPRA